MEVGLRGRHQAANAAVADGLLDALELALPGSLDPARAQGLFSNIANFNYGLGRLRKVLRPIGWQIHTHEDGYQLVKD